MQINLCRLIFDQIKYKNLLLRNCYGRPPDRLPMFQLELREQFDKLEKELIHCLNTIAFVYRWILLLDI